MRVLSRRRVSGSGGPLTGLGYDGWSAVNWVGFAADKALERGRGDESSGPGVLAVHLVEYSSDNREALNRLGRERLIGPEVLDRCVQPPLQFLEVVDDGRVGFRKIHGSSFPSS